MDKKPGRATEAGERGNGGMGTEEHEDNEDRKHGVWRSGVMLEGEFEMLEPLDPDRHMSDLFASSNDEAKSWTFIRRRLPAGHRLQGTQPGHRLICGHRRRVAGLGPSVRNVARAGQLRQPGPPANPAVRFEQAHSPAARLTQRISQILSLHERGQWVNLAKCWYQNGGKR